MATPAAAPAPDGRGIRGTSDADSTTTDTSGVSGTDRAIAEATTGGSAVGGGSTVGGGSGVGGETTDGSDEPDDGRLVDLVRAAQRGDALAMQELLTELTPYVGRLAGPIALDDGPDAAQEALITIFTGLKQLREPAALFGWARAITVRAAVRVAQQAGRARPADLMDVPDPGDPQLAADVHDVLDRLSPEHRAVLMLRDLEGLDEQSIGDLLALPPGTVKSRLFRARRSFRKAWGR